MSIENKDGYRSEEERIAAEQFNKEKNASSGNDDVEKALLEQLSRFQKTETEQFIDTNENLQNFVNEINEKFSDEDKKEIYDALMLMFTAHIYQKDRPSGDPYVSHPLTVAKKVISMPQKPDKELVIAALMHDSVEDQADKLASLAKDKHSELSDEQNALEEIRVKYGERVKNIVSHLSNPDLDSILKSRGITKENPQYMLEKISFMLNM